MINKKMYICIYKKYNINIKLMKTIITTLLLAVAFTGCELPEVNQKSEPLTSEYMVQYPLPDKLEGSYRALTGKVTVQTGEPYETGTMEISKDSIVVNLSKHKYALRLKDHTTISNLLKDCFFEIKLKDGTIIKIHYFHLDAEGIIYLEVNDLYFAELTNRPEEPTQPEEPTEPETPVILN